MELFILELRKTKKLSSHDRIAAYQVIQEVPKTLG